MNGYTGDRPTNARLIAWLASGTLCVASLATTAWAQAPLQGAAPEQATESQGEESVEKAPAEGAEAAETAQLDPELLAKWVRELDDDRYAVRETAQKQLAAAGSAGLDTASQVAATGSLESATRAVSVLVGWADSKDNKLSLAALERLAALDNRPVESAMANERLAVVREAAAMETIKELGGRFDFDRSLGMMAGPNAPLQVIIGPQWKGGIEGLKHIAAVRNATTLSLHSAPFKDEAADEIAACTQVRRLELYGMDLSPETLAKLQPQMPNTVFDIRRGGARLGIRGLTIEQIVVDSPAEKAGLQRNDKIIEFASKPIADFEQLTQEIAKCKPGDTVSIKIQHGAETLEKTVTFDRWGDDERTIMDSPELQQGFAPVQIQGGGRIIIQPGGQILPAGPIPVPAGPLPVPAPQIQEAPGAQEQRR